MEINLAIVGSRYYNDYNEFSNHLETLIKEIGMPNKIIAGGASGTDTMAKKFALSKKIKFIEYLPDWKKFSKSVGLIRNQYIIDDATHLISIFLITLLYNINKC